MHDKHLWCHTLTMFVVKVLLLGAVECPVGFITPL